MYQLNFNNKSIKLFNKNFLDAEIKRKVDLFVTSPPYNINAKYDIYDDDLPYSKYLTFTKKWLKHCYYNSSKHGRICINVPFTIDSCNHKPVYSDVVQTAKNVGWKYYTTIIWYKQNIAHRNIFGSYLSANAPCISLPAEAVIIMYKNNWKKVSEGGIKLTDIERKEFIDYTNGFWIFNGQQRSIGHPAAFNLILPTRCIKLFSFKDDLICDPFVGSGTTLLACIETNRNGLGYEISKNYCNIAKQRIKNHIKLYED